MVAIDSSTNGIGGATPKMLGADISDQTDMISVGAVTQGIIVESFPGATQVNYWTDFSAGAEDNIVYVEINGAEGLLGTFAYRLSNDSLNSDGLWDIPFSLFAAGLPPPNGGNGEPPDNGGGGMDVIEQIARVAPSGRRLRDFRAGINATCNVLENLAPFAEVLPRRFQIAIDALQIACQIQEVIPGVAKKLKKVSKAFRPF